LQATANKIDLDELLAIAEAFTPERRAARRGAPSPPMKVVAQLKADAATAAGVQLTQFTTNMSLDGDRFAMSPMTFGLFGGSYDGSLTGRLGGSMSATLKSRLKGLDVAQLAAFGGSPDTITGTLSGEGTFSAQGADMAAMLASANGKGSASIVDGSIKRLHFVRTVILFFGRPAPDAGESSDRFDRLEAKFSLANRIVNTDAFQLHSQDADTAGTGTLNLDTDALDGRADLTLSEALSKQAGTDLIRYTREGNRERRTDEHGRRILHPVTTAVAGAQQPRVGGIEQMIGVERIDRHRDRATDKESCIDRHPGLAAVASAKGAAPCARIVRETRLRKSEDAKHDEADAQHRSFEKSGLAETLRGAG